MAGSAWQRVGARRAVLTARARAPRPTALQEATDDVQKLARLWQLQDKMQAVGATAATSGGGASAYSSGSSGYEARLERVAAAREGLEDRLAKRLELLDGYTRVMNMIEIEVELETEVRACGVGPGVAGAQLVARKAGPRAAPGVPM
jgi:hypothetical protein